jgi:mRNA-degrading endonuclease RelE of RelBE toxin-antitoxin system
LPKQIQDKIKKQIQLLKKSPDSSSLQVKKMANADYYEARIDLHYRMRFLWTKDQIIIVSLGQHDTGLGKK